jgi:DNA-binding LacI/PurR family transcriptional regulator
VPDDGKGYWEAQVAAMAAFLTEHPETTAILATDDELAYVAWQAAGRVGYDVPTDLSIVCFDAVVPCPAVWSFTSAIQDQAVIGREAARLILAAVAGEPAGPTEVTVPVSMHMGQSTAAAPRRSSLALRS